MINYIPQIIIILYFIFNLITSFIFHGEEEKDKINFHYELFCTFILLYLGDFFKINK